MGNLAVVEKLDRLLQAICQSLVDRDFRYRAESHCSIFAILLGRIPGDRYRSVSATQPILGAGGPADGRPTMTKAVHCDGDHSCFDVLEGLGQIGSAHILTPCTNSHIVFRLLLEKKKFFYKRTHKKEAIKEHKQIFPTRR